MPTQPKANDYSASEDFPDDMVREAEGQPDPESEAAQRHATVERLQQFGYTLARKRDDWIQNRRAYGVDRRWRDDTDQYHNIDNANRNAADMMKSVEQGYPVTTHGAQAHRSTVFIGLTRQKTNAGEARLADIVLPTDELNFGIDPTPNPTLARALKDERPVVDASGQAQMIPMKDPTTGVQATGADGQPLTQVKKFKDVAEEEQRVAREAANGMQREIEDQLVECDYNAEVRKMLHDAAVLGTGVLKGPIATSRTRKAWVKVTPKPPEGQFQQTPVAEAAYHVLKVVERVNPASMWVSAWNVWPDPACGDNVQNGEGVFERELLTRKKVQDLAKQPFYNGDALTLVLQQGPQKTKVFNDIDDPRTKDLLKDTLFEVWHYVGEIDVEDMRGAGVQGLPDEDDQLTRVSGCVVMINDIVVKAYLNPLETDDLPYDFYPWEKVSDSVWGYGIPYLMRAQQRVMNAAWRQMMDNAGITSGPQIVIRKGAITPADGKWELHSRKIWYANIDVEDVEKAFMSVDIESHQAELQAIIGMAEDLADKETGQPMITQGDQGTAPETVGGMQLLMNAANVVLRRLVKQFDDYVTKPHIRRYYDFNMSYSDKDENKGDFEINAKGASALLIKDLQNQAYMQLMQVASNPVFAPLFKLRALVTRALSAQHVPADEVLKSEDELKQEAEIAAKNPPKDPALMVAEARVEEAKSRSAGYASEIELRREIAGQNFAGQLEKLKLEKDIAMLKYATEQNKTLEQIRAELTQTVIQSNTQKQMQATEIALKQSPENPTNEGI